MIVKNMKYEQDEEIIFKYDNFKRSIILLAYLGMIGFGFFLISLYHLFAIIFGYLLIIVGLFYFIDIFFLKYLIISNKCITKEWFLFGRIRIKNKDLIVSVSKRIWTGQIFFKNKNRSYFYNRLMIFEVFPIGNKGFKEIKEILIKEQIIKGDEYEWNI